MIDLEQNLEKIQERQIDLLEKYLEFWELWIETKSDDLVDKMDELKNKIDHISMGIQVSAILKNFKKERANIVVPNLKIM